MRVVTVPDIVVHVHVHMTEEPGSHEFLTLLRDIDMRSTAMALDLTALTAEVQQTQDAQQSAITLIEGIAQALRDAAADPVAIQALADQLDAGSNALAAAVAAATPPPVEPPV